MNQEPLRVEFRVELGNRRPVPKRAPGTRAERQRVDRAARRARNLALAYWIDHLVRSGQVTDLAAAAKLCRVSRASLTKLCGMRFLPVRIQDLILADTSADPASNCRVSAT